MPLPGENAKCESTLRRRIRYSKQVVLAMGASLGMATMGMTVTWPNALLRDLRVNNATLMGTQLHLAEWQKDLMGSVVFVGSLPGILVAGWILGSLGRRRSMAVGAAPGLLGWILVALGANVSMLVLGRMLQGFTLGMVSVAATTYITELPDASIRGFACVLPTLFAEAGNLFVASLSLVLPWYHLAFVCASVTALFIVITFLLPESPSYLVFCKEDARALKVLAMLRGPDASVEEELRILKKQNEGLAGDNPGWRSLLKGAVVRRILVVVALFLVQSFSGLMVFVSNASRILRSVGSALDERHSTIVVFGVELLGCACSCCLQDRFGRRRSVVFSLVVMAAALVAMGTYVFLAGSAAPAPVEVADLPAHALNSTFYLHVPRGEDDLVEVGTELSASMMREAEAGLAGWEWVPLACLVIYMFVMCLGIRTVPYILASEYFPTTIRPQATSVCMTFASFIIFAALQTYSLLLEALTQAGLYWTYGAVATGGALFSLVFITETSGKTIG
ncbi:facilitated trehalose transporter Tret1-like [Penaeus japonicus]|uniref:facilitated trehalose transporter Tret1-like n=1 Tax=Penaeus japonicus TaxID=27405 RepID=UPI001C7106CD|nr:facilitated trehalose transporter Tret1-like [Penaeus japonicus]